MCNIAQSTAGWLYFILVAVGDPRYDIEYRCHDDMPFFNKPGTILLTSFIVDVSVNHILNQYLVKNTGVGRKKEASPEKDSEVVVFNPPYDLVIKNHMDGFYVIYALQMKYHFLSNRYIADALISDIWQMDAEVFLDYEAEKVAFQNIIYYLHYNWGYEEQISQGVYKLSEESAHLSVFYDPILQHHGIQNDTFEETCDLISFYNMDPIANIALKYCYIFLKN